jgi:hypothetical protein
MRRGCKQGLVNLSRLVHNKIPSKVNGTWRLEPRSNQLEGKQCESTIFKYSADVLFNPFRFTVNSRSTAKKTWPLDSLPTPGRQRTMHWKTAYNFITAGNPCLVPIPSHRWCSNLSFETKCSWCFYWKFGTLWSTMRDELSNLDFLPKTHNSYKNRHWLSAEFVLETIKPFNILSFF